MKKNPSASRRAHTPTVFQMEAAECGAASLSMILRYYGCHLPMEEVRGACGVSRNGCSAAGIVTAAREYGLDCSGYRVKADRLAELPVPCILHWNNDHFVVLDGIHGKKIWLNDPAHGHITLSMEELLPRYSGTALVFRPGEHFRRVAPKRIILQGLRESLTVFRNTWVFLAVSGIALIFPGLILPVLTKTFLDQVVIGGTGNWLRMVLLGIAVLTISQAGISFLRSAVLARVKMAQTLEGNHRLIAKMLRLPIHYFEQRYAGELSQREEAVGRIYEFIDGSLADVALHLFEAVFFFLMMWLFSRRLSVISLFGAAVNVGIMVLVNHRLSELSVKQLQDRNRLMGLLCAGLAVFPTVKASGCENDYYSLLMDQYAASTESDMRLTRAGQILGSLPQTMFQMLNVTILIIGSGFVIRGGMTVGTLTAFTQVLASFLTPVSQLLAMERQLQTLRADLEMVEDIHGATDDPVLTAPEQKIAVSESSSAPDTAGSAAPDRFRPLQGALEARHLTFGYMRGQPVIRDFSLRMAPGSRVGIVGVSGCGKSTVGKLLAGLETPWQGEVLLDGVPLNQVPQEVRCASFSVVSQKEAFFAGSIRDNLTFWNPEESEQRIFMALFDAEALNLVNGLPGGLDYQMKEGGHNFSGGQLQQLAIARALMNDPAILLLDEATSAMDPMRERAILNKLRRRGCTCVMIAHRLSTILDCDLILVMKDGRMAECGTHDRLMAAGGLYASLYGGKEAAS